MELPAYHPFRSQQAKERFWAQYDLAAQKWPGPCEQRTVQTSHGQTFMRINGSVDAPPLVLLPGINATSLMWGWNVAALSTAFRTYAVDSIYDHGRSIYTRPFREAGDFVGWLDELFDALGLGNKLRIMAASYGAWMACQYALRFPERLERLVLLAPAGTVVPLGVGFIVRGLLALVPQRLFLRQFMHWMAEDTWKSGPAGRSMLKDMVDFGVLARQCYPLRPLVAPSVLSDDELRSLKVATLFMVGENEKLFSLRKALQRLASVAPHIQTEIIPNAGHDLFMVQAELVNRKALAFLTQP